MTNNQENTTETLETPYLYVQDMLDLYRESDDDNVPLDAEPQGLARFCFNPQRPLILGDDLPALRPGNFSTEQYRRVLQLLEHGATQYRKQRAKSNLQRQRIYALENYKEKANERISETNQKVREKKENIEEQRRQIRVLQATTLLMSAILIAVLVFA